MSHAVKNIFKLLLVGLVAAVIFFVGGLLAYLFWFQPPFYFPRPTGPHAVGTQEFHWVDTNRLEKFSSDPAHTYRELMVKVWYPAEGKLPEKPMTPYAPKLVAWHKQHNFLFWLASGLSRPTLTYARENAPIDTNVGQYPVILFSPGGGGVASSNSAQCEELASHGFFVVGVSYPYESWVVHFPDGRTIVSIPDKPLPFKQRRAVTDQDIEIRIADMRFVLDELVRLAHTKDFPFYGQLNLGAIGAMGQSLGGATAVQLCRRDPRVKAGVDMDGSMFGIDATAPVDTPLLFMLSDTNATMMQRALTDRERKSFNITAADEEAMFKVRYPLPSAYFSPFGRSAVYTFILKGAGHSDFTNFALHKEASVLRVLLPLINRFGLFSLVGKIDGRRATEIVDAYLVNFFNKYLKGMSSEVLDGGQGTYPEIKRMEERHE